jgi:hypothetical protein
MADEERTVVPLVPFFGVLTESVGHLNARGKFIEDQVWLAGVGTLPAGTRVKRLPKAKPMPEIPQEPEGLPSTWRTGG